MSSMSCLNLLNLVPYIELLHHHIKYDFEFNIKFLCSTDVAGRGWEQVYFTVREIMHYQNVLMMFIMIQTARHIFSGALLSVGMSEEENVAITFYLLIIDFVIKEKMQPTCHQKLIWC